jgi:hypothetical protein
MFVQHGEPGQHAAVTTQLACTGQAGMHTSWCANQGVGWPSPDAKCQAWKNTCRAWLLMSSGFKGTCGSSGKLQVMYHFTGQRASRPFCFVKLLAAEDNDSGSEGNGLVMSAVKQHYVFLEMKKLAVRCHMACGLGNKVGHAMVHGPEGDKQNPPPSSPLGRCTTYSQYRHKLTQMHTYLCVM